MAKKILLAEDSITMQKVVEMTFAAEDFSVTTVSTGEGAIQQAKEVKPDIVIADLSMGGKNGYDISTALKSDPSLASIPVLLIHGSAVPYDSAKGKAAQADDEIVKPFETQALIDKVRALTEAAPAVRKEPFGPIESLAPPMGGGSDDIVIDTASLDKPAAAAPRPAAPRPAVAPARPAAPRSAAPLPKPAAPPKPPAMARPAAPPVPKPAPPPPMPAAPKPTVVGRPAASKPAPEAVEITIEAEPPPAGSGVVQWDKFDVPTFDQKPAEGPLRSDATLLGVGEPTPAPAPIPKIAPPPPGLPPPPPGMPLPPMGAKPAPAPPLQPGQPYEPAVYEAITKLSREVIERIVWEVVPDLAEQIIREELDRLVEKRRSG